MRLRADVLDRRRRRRRTRRTRAGVRRAPPHALPVFDDAMRMLDVEAELDARGWLSGSKLWIRYNPNRCKIGNATRAAPIPHAERERWLRDVLTRLALTPDFPSLVLYAFYPTPSAASPLPKTAFHPDFPNELLERVRSHVQPHAGESHEIEAN